MKPSLKRIAFYAVILVCGIFVWGTWQVGRQGLSDEEWKKVGPSQVLFDVNGIPKITATNWKDAVETQGFVIAAERMWQMDLMRRRGAGRLSEWFGEKASNYDEQQRILGLSKVASEAADGLPEIDRVYCDAYAAGVNRFIDRYDGRWGLEYQLLSAEPEPWSCRDSMLVVLTMVESMTAATKREEWRGLWREKVGEQWAKVIFSQKHPWNIPIVADSKPDLYPPIPSALAPVTIDQFDVKQRFKSPMYVGSNNWAYRGEAGWFLANDPHLVRRVPQTWYAVKIFLSKTSWVVGAALPGIPGVVLGMNPHLAWAFTNTGEDVDDLIYLQKGDAEDEYSYLNAQGEKVSRRFLVRQDSIRIKGQLKPKVINIRQTEFGPIVGERADGTLIARRWLATRPEMLGLPVIRINQAADWSQINAAIDSMGLPAQNVVVLQRDGAMGYRTSGTGIARKGSGRWPRVPSEAQWLQIKKPSTRPRVYHPASKLPPVSIATANQRIWVDGVGHSWTSDDRAARIKEVLAKSANLSFDEMAALQLDTRSRYLLVLRDFILAHIDESSDQMKSAMVKQWRGWDGVGKSNGDVYDDLQHADAVLTNILLSRLLHSFGEKETDIPQYSSWLRRAWVLRYLQSNELRRAFGLAEKDVVTYLLAETSAYRKQRKGSYAARNRWQAQHPFVGRIPLIGGLFRVKEPEQHGGKNVVKVETPKMGASMRLLWNLSSPEKSRWAFPVGQSGHIRSPFYRNQQSGFAAGAFSSVFSPEDVKVFGL